MRVSDDTLFRQFLASLNSSKENTNRLLRQIADGKKVRYASDDVSGARTALELRGRLVRTEGYRRSAAAARLDLSTLDSSLSEMFNLVSGVRGLAMAGASTAVQDANSLRAEEVDAQRGQLLALANTYQNGRYLFGGTETLDPPFDGNGVYSGNGDEARAAIDREQTVTVTLSGERVLQAGGDVLATLSDLSEALRNNDGEALQEVIARLDGELDNLNRIRGEVGARMQTIDGTVRRLEDEQVRLQGRIIEIEDVDLAQAIVELAEENEATEALSRTGATVMGRSLFDFLG